MVSEIRALMAWENHVPLRQIQLDFQNYHSVTKKILALLTMTEERTKTLICDMWGIGNFPLDLELSFRKSGKWGCKK